MYASLQNIEQTGNHHPNSFFFTFCPSVISTEVPPVQPLDAKGFSAERTRRVLKDLAACGPKYVALS